jgi:putative DNA primase/helicase
MKNEESFETTPSGGVNATVTNESAEPGTLLKGAPGGGTGPTTDAAKPPRTVFDLAPVDPWPEAVDGAALLDDLARLLTRFVILPPAAADALALWTLHTYAFHLRDITAYVGIESPEKRCGKTTLLELLSLIVSRPVVASNITPPAIFRAIQEAMPTLIIDEADTFFRGNDELRGILNAGYTRRTAFVMRVDWPSGQSTPTLAKFSCWCPKVMAAIGRLPDTLADRCILIRMQRKLPQERCDRLKNLQTVETAGLRRRCARFVLDHQDAIASVAPELPPALHDRAADVWEPLLALADLSGGPWPARSRQAATTLSASENENSTVGSLVLDIMCCFYETSADRMLSRQLVKDLNRLGERPWSDLSGNKPINEHWHFPEKL